MDLTFEEADYLRDRIMTNHLGTLLATLVILSADPPDVDRRWELSPPSGLADIILGARSPSPRPLPRRGGE